MERVLFDSSIYIAAFRAGGGAAAALGKHAPAWLSSVVLEELYAGAAERDRYVIERLESDFRKVGRILVPDLSDWVGTGKVLARLAAKYDYEKVGRGRLTNDALIAMSAGRLKITVITANMRDFARIAEFRSFVWRINTTTSN
jgi:predicted nucleic acid-binding protein